MTLGPPTTPAVLLPLGPEERTARHLGGRRER